MSKPPSKSGGSGRGRPPRDRSWLGDAPRGRGSRDGERSGGGRGRDTADAPRGTERSRSGPAGTRGTAPRDDARRTDNPRGAPRSAAPRPPRREDAQRGERGDATSRESRPRGSSREDAPRSYSRGDTPRRDARDGAPRATYSRGPARNDRDTREERRGAGPRRSDTALPRRPIARPGPAPRAAAPTPKDPTLPAREGERIAKLLARAGIASRREVERLIIEGRVRLNDAVVETPSTVLTSLQGITVDGNPVAEAQGTRLFVFHKPSGLITAERDPAGRPTIYTALRNSLPQGSGRVMPIGRLDLNTEGLLLLTNDGEFKRQLELPATGVPRTYRARTFGDITQARLEELMEGIEVDGVIYGRIDANMERRTGRNQWIEMTLTEGKNREVRRVLEALELQVSRLIRVAYGPFVLGDLPKGAAYEVLPRDLEGFRRTLPATAAKESKA
ncbi:pseudouridine synthase [Novosphingobium sp. FGD1]|uniref:Pseudouridine synthase n=1 Tax=Novosphingobium silvae TaxID=2692619 RepID=A0A7X4GIA4_9SPHN|nr:pseudouridine synthase [Novosphingobium silvae]MYL98267.1 pseudouridine synthase [Novosphingobium silvae]